MEDEKLRFRHILPYEFPKEVSVGTETKETY